MNNAIKNQLDKVTEVKISYDDNTTNLFIPRKTSIKLDEDKYYIIKLSDFMLAPPIGSPIVSNWNGGSIPKYRYYKIDVIKIMGDMIKVNGIAYDYDNKIDINDIWQGWIPKTEIEIMECL